MDFGAWGGAILVIATTVPPLRKERNICLEIAGIPPLTNENEVPPTTANRNHVAIRG